jgi:hypothetical protein
LKVQDHLQLIRNYFYGSPGLSLTKKNLIGLHLEKEQLYYVSLTWTRNGWSATRPSKDLEPCGTVQGTSPSSLKQFLEWQTVLPLVDKSAIPRQRVYYLTLPRSFFSVRDLQLPAMPMEDALASVENSLPVCCHLPVDEIYYDIQICRTQQGAMNALIVYAPRDDMDVFLNIFRETGQLDFLGGIFPQSIGIGAWLSLQGYPMPMGLVLSTDETSELAVYQKNGCLFSGAFPVPQGSDAQGPDAQGSDARGSDERDLTLASAKARTQGLNENVFSLDGDGFPPLPEPVTNCLAPLPLVTENPGIGAVAPVLSSQQEISIHGHSPKLKSFRPARLAVPLLLILGLMIFFMSWHAWRELRSHQEEVESLKAELSTLKNKLEPMELARKTVKNRATVFKDVNTFIHTRPALFSRLNEIARNLPEGTWFSQFNYRDGSMTLRGQGPDALKVIESLRSSGVGERVDLEGTVNKDATGTERFALVIKLKDRETDK